MLLIPLRSILITGIIRSALNHFILIILRAPINTFFYAEDMIMINSEVELSH
jgi:hypothetical protein